MNGHATRAEYAAPLLGGDEDELEKIEQGDSRNHENHNVSTAYFNGWPTRPSLRHVSCLPLPTPQSPKSLASWLLYGMIPSFIQSRLSPSSAPEKIHPTAYLDGMRGLAAFAVYLCHLSYQFFYITFGYGQGEPGENAWLIQLPIVRLFYSGPPMVAIFFVISGYALSYKPIKLMRARQYDSLLQTLSSSAFRRPFRLFLPCFFSTLLVFILLRLRIYEYTRPFSDNHTLKRGKHEDHVIFYSSFVAQFWDYYNKWFDFIHVFDYGIYSGSMDYDRHLWTIPSEFRASMFLFLTHLMASRLRTALRLAFFVGLIQWGGRWQRWELCLFWSGCILAELDQIQLAHTKAKSIGTDGNAESRKSRYHRLMRWFWIANFICGLYVASYPDSKGSETPGYIWLGSMTPKFFSVQRYRFWPSVGAVQIVWATNNTSVLKGLFTGPVVQYLGKISYALYLMHGPVIHTFGYVVLPWIWGYTGIESRFHYEFGFFLSGCLITAMIIWVSDMFWRGIDVPCVTFARWLESKVIVKQD